MKTPEERRQSNTEAQRRWRLENPEKAKAAGARYRAKHLEQERARDRERQRAKRAANPGKVKEREHRAEDKRRAKRAAVFPRPRPEACEVCGGGGRIVFDHCHQTNSFRGWLCDGCNLSLGLVHNDPLRLRLLAAYLEQGKD